MPRNRLPHRAATRAALLIAVLAASSIATANSMADTPPPGDIPDNQAFVVYHGSGYSLKVPEGWSRATRSGTTTFVDKYNGISVATMQRGKAPTVTSAKRTEIAQLKATTKGFAQPVVTAVSRPGGSGVLVTYHALSAPNSVTGKSVTDDVERYELWRAGKLAVITLEAPHGSDNVDAWRLITSSLRWAK
jgi:hypothetical protein